VKQETVTVIGAGLAGSECAFRLASLGHRVVLCEQKPVQRSPAHKSDRLAELVCSNSFRSDNPQSAIGLLHAELRRVNSLILTSADATRVPAGDALAVDRERFADAVEGALKAHPNIEFRAGEVTSIPDGLVVVATGPLTSDLLTKALAPHVGEKLYFYDAIAPIVAADSIDMSKAFFASRWGKGDGDDYLNLPMNKAEYGAFVAALCAGARVVPHAFEEPKYFEGCLPIEVMAERGERVLSFGPMKPVGLTDPKTGRWAYAVVQLRKEDVAGTAFNLVGFQTRLTWPEQKRIFSMIPGLEQAEWVRMGQIHRNTFIESPRLLEADLSLKNSSQLFFAGQISGVEGYVESTACGYLVALSVHARLTKTPFVPPPAETALGALYRHVTGEAHPAGHSYQPSNVVFALFPPIDVRAKKAQKREMYSKRAFEAFEAWIPQVPHAVKPRVEPATQDLQTLTASAMSPVTLKEHAL
jgi:methylenetetrahydrofolate--tRNA-(uracil-5-)-methyltransferase